MATGLELTEQRIREQDAAFHQQMMDRAGQAAADAGRRAAATPQDAGPNAQGLRGVMETLFGKENADILGGTGKMAFGYGMLTELTNMLEGGMVSVSGGNGLAGQLMETLQNTFTGLQGPEAVIHFGPNGAEIADPAITPEPAAQPAPATGPQMAANAAGPGMAGPGLAPGM